MSRSSSAGPSLTLSCRARAWDGPQTTPGPPSFQASCLLSQKGGENHPRLPSPRFLLGHPPLRWRYPKGVQRRKSCSHQPLLPTEPSLGLVKHRRQQPLQENVVFLCTGEYSFPYRFCKAEGRFRCCFSIIIASLSKIHFSCERAFGGSESPWRSSVLPAEKPQICRSLKITVPSAGSSFFHSQCPPLQRKCS